MAGMVVAQFVVQKDGILSDVKILRSIHPDGDKEVLRAMALMPKWLPGTLDGEAVPVRFAIPVRFSIEKSNRVTVSKPIQF